MPLKKGSDTTGQYWQYGTQKKYYFGAAHGSEREARKKAIAQMVAIKSNTK